MKVKGQKFATDPVPLGINRWLTVVSAEDPDGTELLLESSDHSAVGPYREVIAADGIAAHSFQVQDLDAEWKRLSDLGVKFVTEPMDAGTVYIAVLDDTCGNLIQLIQMKDA